MNEKHQFKVWLGKDNDCSGDYCVAEKHPEAEIIAETWYWLATTENSASFCKNRFERLTGVKLKKGQLAHCKVTVEILEVWNCEYDKEAEKDYEVEE